MMHDPNWPVGLLASAYSPYHDPQRLTMAICVGYFEAGQPPDAPAAITVAGLISPKARWRYFDERWPRVLRHEGLAAFNGQDFIHGTREFTAGWADNGPRRRRLVQTLTRLAEQHVLRGCSCSLRLDDYEAINEEYRFAEAAGGPYGICAAGVIGHVQAWMAQHHPDDLTLFVFEDGDTDHREIRRILMAEGIERGEPVQLWPRQWTDERGRHRFLRPFEACDLLIPGCDSGLTQRLTSRDSYEHHVLDREHLLRICGALAVGRRAMPSLHNAAV